MAEQLDHFAVAGLPTHSPWLRALGHEGASLDLGQPRDVPHHEPLDSKAGFLALELTLAVHRSSRVKRRVVTITCVLCWVVSPISVRVHSGSSRRSNSARIRAHVCERHARLLLLALRVTVLFPEYILVSSSPHRLGR